MCVSSRNKQRHCVAVVLLLFMCFAFARVVRADDAKTEFEAGIAAFHAEDFPGALAAFEASYALRPLPKVLFNIAMCQKAMYRYKEALESFQLFVDQAALSEMDPLLDEVALERAQLMTKVGRINIVTTPLDAAIRVDGKDVGRSPLPSPVVLNPGAHTVELDKEGYQTDRRRLSVIAGEEIQLRVQLSKNQGSVEIRCPLRGQLLLNQTQEEMCPFVGRLPVGAHRVELRLPGFETMQRTFVLANEERLLLDLTTPSAGMVQAETDVGSRHRSPALLAAGAVVTTLAAGAGVLGGYFLVQGDNAYEEGLLAVDEGNSARYDDINENKLPAYRIGAIASFVSAGVLLATGVTLIIRSSRKKETAPSGTARLRMRLDGIIVRF